MIPKADWKWYGNAAHFICGQWCRFHLATKVGRVVVSTIGEYVHPRNSKGSERAETEWLSENPLGENVGAGRKFETMVFPTRGDKCECGCGLPTVVYKYDLDFMGHDTREDATKGHMEMCERWADEVRQGKAIHEAFERGGVI